MAARMPRRLTRSRSTPATRRGDSARAGAAFARLVEIMATLRSPHGCPWDRRQTHRSLRPYLLEETYEALDAIERRDFAALRDELGDVLFQVVFHSEVAAAGGRFEVADVIRQVTSKLIRRHPHVFTPAGVPLGRSKRSLAQTRARGVGTDQSQRAVRREGARGPARRRAPLAAGPSARAQDRQASGDGRLRLAARGGRHGQNRRGSPRTPRRVVGRTAREPRRSSAICCSRWRTSRENSALSPKPP